MLTFRFTKADGRMVEEETLTSGMVGKEVKLEFSEEWENFSKTVVFSAGEVSRDVAAIHGAVTIPHEVLAEGRNHLYVGVYGISGDGRVIPTVRARGPFIQPGAEPAGEKGREPTLPVWAQIHQQIAGLREEVLALAGVSVADDGNGNVTIKTGGA